MPNHLVNLAMRILLHHLRLLMKVLTTDISQVFMASECYVVLICQIQPLPFGRICFVVLVMRKGGESS